MKTVYFLLFVTILYNSSVYSQEFNKSVSLSSISDIVATGSNIDTTNKYIYHVGRFNEELVVNEQMKYISTGSWDNFILKTDFNNELLSVEVFGSDKLDLPANLQVDPSGNVFIASSFRDSVTVQGKKIKSVGLFDILLAKYDKIGTLQWIKNVGSGGNVERVNNIFQDQSGSILMSGYFTDSIVFTGDTLYSNYPSNNFLSLFNSNGEYQWSYMNYGTHAFNKILSITQIESNYYISGRFRDTLFLGNDTLINTGTTNGAYIAKINDAGIFQEARVIDGSMDDYDANLVSDGTDLYLTGYFFSHDLMIDSTKNEKSNIPFTSRGSRDIFLLKYSGNDFNLLWSKHIGGIGDDVSSGLSLANDNIMLTGYFANFLALGDDTIYTTGTLNIDPFICTMDKGGNIINARSIKGIGNYIDSGTGIVAYNDNIFSSGYYTSEKLILYKDTLYNNSVGRKNFYATKLNCLPITFSSATPTHPLCYNDSTGAISIDASGGFTELLFSIDSGQSYFAHNEFAELPAGEYNLIIKDSAGCMQDGGQVTITQPEEFVIDTSYYTDVTSYQGADGTITVEVSGGTTPYIFTLNEGDVQTSGEYTGLIAGNYKVAVDDANNCGPLETDTITIAGPTEIAEFEIGQVKVYPNPVSSLLRIEMDNVETPSLILTLYDATGRLLMNREVQTANGVLSESIDVSAFAKGIMFLKVGNQKKMVPVLKVE